MTSLVSTYTKPFLTVDEQLKRLTVRGMLIENPEEAMRELQSIGYYRLSRLLVPIQSEA